MNCKPDQLAYVSKDGGIHDGKIVRCLRLSSWHGLRVNGQTVLGPVWETDPPMKRSNGDFHNLWLDESLRPLRDPGDDAVDESKAYLPPVPKVEHA